MINKRLCINCRVPMKKTFVDYKGIKFEARRCPRCEEKIFTENLALNVVNSL